MVNYKLLIKKSAVKELEELPKMDLQRITQRIQNLSQNPRPLGCQKLSGAEKYRIRQGNYRVIYAIIENSQIVEIVKVGHRRDVYR